MASTLVYLFIDIFDDKKLILLTSHLIQYKLYEMYLHFELATNNWSSVTIQNQENINVFVRINWWSSEGMQEAHMLIMLNYYC